MQRLLFFLFFIFSIYHSQAQVNKFTISGYIKDDKTGEALIGASIAVKELTNVGAMTNEYGFYSLTIPSGDYTIIVQSFGFSKKEIAISLTSNQKMDFSLAEEVIEMEEVTIFTEKKNENITQTQMGVEKLEMKEINKVPVLMGEKDILKTMQLIPGIKSAGEGNSGFYVRGGGADQNLILLDEAPVYNASHLLGFFSLIT